MRGSQVQVVRQLKPAGRAEVQEWTALDAALLRGVGSRADKYAPPSLLDVVLQETLDRPGRELLERVLRRTEAEDVWRRGGARNLVARGEAARVLTRASPLRVGFGGIPGMVVENAIRAGFTIDWEQLQAGWSRLLLGEDVDSSSRLWMPGGAIFPDGWSSPQVGADGLVGTLTNAGWWVVHPDQYRAADIGYDAETAFYAATGFNKVVTVSPGSQVDFWELRGTVDIIGSPFYWYQWSGRAQWDGATSPFADVAPSNQGPLPVKGGGWPQGVGWRKAAAKTVSDWPTSWRGGNRPPEEPPPPPPRDRRGPEDTPRTKRRLGRRFGVPRFPRRGGEKKINMASYHQWMLVRVLEGATETSDFIGALFQALPDEVRRHVRAAWVAEQFAAGVKRPAREVPDNVKAEALWDYARFIHAEGAVRELLWEAIQDALVPVAGAGFAEAGGRVQRRGQLSGGSSGLDSEWGTRQPDATRPDTLPSEWMGWLQRQVTQREARRAEQSRSELVRQFAIDARIRRTREWSRARTE